MTLILIKVAAPFSRCSTHRERSAKTAEEREHAGSSRGPYIFRATRSRGGPAGAVEFKEGEPISEAAYRAGAASRAALVAYGWAERFSQICDETVEALEASADAYDWVTFCIDQITGTRQEFTEGEVYDPYTGEIVDQE